MDRSKVQVLYVTCCGTFSKGGLSTFKQIQYLKTLLDLQIELKLLMWESMSFVTSDSLRSSPESGGSRGLLVDPDLQPLICPEYVAVFCCSLAAHLSLLTT